MKRSEVESKYKWRLEDIFATNEAWEKAFESVKTESLKVKNFKGKLNNKESLLACFKFMDETEHAIFRLYIFARMRRDEDANCDLYVGMASRTEKLVTDFYSAASFFNAETAALPESYLLDAAADKNFVDFDYAIKEIIRQKKYILSDKEEKIMAMAGNSLGGFQEAFIMLDNADLKFDEVKIDGKKEKLTHGKYSFCMQHKDRKIRKAAFESMYKAYRSHINTIAALYSHNVKKDNFYADARGYSSCLQKALYGDDVPVAVYDNLIKMTRKSMRSLHDYVTLRKRILGYKTMFMYDMYIPVIEEVKMDMPYEDAYKLVIDGLAPLGQNYKNLLIEARDRGWIDVLETEGIKSGAYSWGTYGTHPYVLLNYSRTAHDIFTIAHEMGHAMHSYFSNNAQPHAKHGYTIFVAEVASTVNEVLLLKHMIKTAKDKNVKKYMLNYYLDMFRTTLFRQTMFAEFEAITHEMDAKGEPLTVAALNEKYIKLNKKYYGKSVRHDDNIACEWARIPHFYNAFYVYKYSTGIISAINIVKKILENPSYVNTYINGFLSAGGSDSAYKILKNVGVDLADEAPFAFAAKEFEDTFNMLKKELE